VMRRAVKLASKLRAILRQDERIRPFGFEVKRPLDLAGTLGASANGPSGGQP
jgi:hypothetical protein